MEIIHIPKKILSKKLEPVNPTDLKSGKYNALFEEMHKDMLANNGVGLAANQVGLDLAFFVIDKKLAAENNVPDIYVNPEITEYFKEKDEMEEGCLSIPEYFTLIKRAKKVKFKALDKNGNKIKIKARGLLARIFQHETDHLNGLTIKDRQKNINE